MLSLKREVKRLIGDFMILGGNEINMKMIENGSSLVSFLFLFVLFYFERFSGFNSSSEHSHKSLKSSKPHSRV